jgi:hypothetical protein
MRLAPAILPSAASLQAASTYCLLIVVCLRRIISVGETSMESRGRANASLSERLTEELREFVVVAIYLYICFTALAYLKASILKAEGIDFAPFAFAAIKSIDLRKIHSGGADAPHRRTV